MKAKIFLLLSLCLGLAACNESQEVKNNPYVHYEWGNGEVYVLKFKKIEYKEYIMVHPPIHVNDSTYYSVTLDFAGGPALPIEIRDVNHQSPYIDLVDNYVLLDWDTWYMITNCLALARFKTDLLINKWDEFEIDKQWSLENFYVTQPCEKAYNIKVDSLSSYNNGLKYPYMPYLASMDFNATREWEALKQQGRGAEYREADIKLADSAYMEYKEVLIKMINDGVLDNYKSYEMTEAYGF